MIAWFCLYFFIPAGELVTGDWCLAMFVSLL
jgi:hypothetical protein